MGLADGMAWEREHGTGLPLSPHKGSAISNSRSLERQVEEFLKDRDMADPRLLAIARTQFELGFLALNKAIVKGLEP